MRPVSDWLNRGRYEPCVLTILYSFLVIRRIDISIVELIFYVIGNVHLHNAFLAIVLEVAVETFHLFLSAWTPTEREEFIVSTHGGIVGHDIE